jgi:uncharacterized protein YifN (PemK superfamily)
VLEKPPKGGFSFATNKFNVMAAFKHYPKFGQVYVCNFDTGFKPPEMVKCRPVVVVSQTGTHGRGLCTVIPLSTTPPSPPQSWHHLIKSPPMPRTPPDVEVWAKCDMITTVCVDRREKPHTKSRKGRDYHTIKLHSEDLACLLECIGNYMPFLRPKPARPARDDSAKSDPETLGTPI